MFVGPMKGASSGMLLVDEGLIINTFSLKSGSAGRFIEFRLGVDSAAVRVGDAKRQVAMTMVHKISSQNVC